MGFWLYSRTHLIPGISQDCLYTDPDKAPVIYRSQSSWELAKAGNVWFPALQLSVTYSRLLCRKKFLASEATAALLRHHIQDSVLKCYIIFKENNPFPILVSDRLSLGMSGHFLSLSHTCWELLWLCLFSITTHGVSENIKK